MRPEDVVVVLCTAPRDGADRLVDRLLKARLVACANVVGPVRSHYWWQGRIESGEEAVLILKTVRSRVQELQARIQDWHDYEVPEVLEIAVDGGLSAYLAWVAAECRPRPDPPPGPHGSSPAP